MILSLTKDGRETGSKSINLLPLSHSHPFLKDKIYVTGRKAREEILSFSSWLEGYRKVYFILYPHQLSSLKQSSFEGRRTEHRLELQSESHLPQRRQSFDFFGR